MKTILAAAIAAMVLSSGHANAASLCGDVNQSGSVTAGDALAVLKAAVGQAITLLCTSSGQLPVTGQTTAYGTGSDGNLQAGAPRSFTDNGDGTITDNATGLMWEKKSDDGSIHDQDNSYTWSTGTGNMDGTIVTTFLADLNSGGGFAGYTDWRVPNLMELFSLLNLEVTNPSTFSAFDTGCAATCTVTTCSCTESTLYWSSSTYKSNPPFAWSVIFSDAFAFVDAKTLSRRVRAVRTGS